MKKLVDSRSGKFWTCWWDWFCLYTFTWQNNCFFIIIATYVRCQYLLNQLAAALPFNFPKCIFPKQKFSYKNFKSYSTIKKANLPWCIFGRIFDKVIYNEWENHLFLRREIKLFYCWKAEKKVPCFRTGLDSKLRFAMRNYFYEHTLTQCNQEIKIFVISRFFSLDQIDLGLDFWFHLFFHIFKFLFQLNSYL